MPMTPEQFRAHAMTDADADGRLPLSRIATRDVYPFQTAGLAVMPLEPPQIPESPRHAENGVDCRACKENRPPIWSDVRWALRVYGGDTGAPLVVILESRDHYDLPGLPDALAAELGVSIVHLARAVESLPHIAGAHISRWGDGSERLHVFCFARPEGFAQFRGTCFAIWDDLLPPVDPAGRDGDAAAVAQTLAASYGGTVGGPA